MPAWEYRIVSMDTVGMMNTTIWDTGVQEGYTQFRFSEKSIGAYHSFISNYLNQLGNEGWEVIAVLTTQPSILSATASPAFLLKRPRPWKKQGIVAEDCMEEMNAKGESLR